MRVILGICLWLCLCLTASAHEVRPAYLSLTETQPSEFKITWKQPVLDGRRLKIKPVFPQTCRQTEPLRSRTNATIIERSFLTSCSLTEGRIAISGLERTLTDVFAEINYLSGETQIAVLKPSSADMALGRPTGSPAKHYLWIGVEHIIYGWDHLLFVIGLTLLVARRQILGVATAFTLAHSLTLVMAALGLINIPIRPVEILIAASIVLLGIEIIRKQKGHKSLATERPYLISFAIGLIHGCGFASALSEIGLPKGTELLALLLFNLGVELGQFAVVGLTIIALMAVAKFGPKARQNTEVLLTYGLSSIAMFWMIQRLSDYVI
ncbi:HupE/UreJ family protein [Hellea balneolensis]|uniref:HupE/UreJ family protein n=1 Tax=Hellea balneolensis TaxID=287478 RepID=UPI0004070A67|nr:HupE/UreJ family protein [Hellea balneolensis]